MKLEVMILNRTLRWTQEGIEYEWDPKRAKLVVRECEVETGRNARVLGSKKDEGREDDPALSPTKASRFRAVVARMNCKALGRLDLQFATKDLSRRMANPTKGDWGQARRTAWYLR